MATPLVPIPLSQVPPASAPLPTEVVIPVNIPDVGSSKKTILATVAALGTRLALVYQDAPQLLPGTSAAVPFNLGSLGEDIPLDYANGPYQYGFIAGDWTPSGIIGGSKGDKLELEIQYCTDGCAMDLSAVKLSVAQAAAMPVIVENRCFMLTFRHMGGGWCLVGSTDSYSTSED